MALAVGLVAAPSALATADPASGGTFKLKLNSSFKKQLKNNHVSMKPKKWTISGGSLDPTNNSGTLTLSKKLTFKNKQTGKKAVFKSLEVTGTKFSGKIGGKRKTIAKLSGGTVARSGFDSSVTGQKAKFKAAKTVNNKLDLSSLKNKKMGTATKTTTFSSLTVTGGSAQLVIDPTAAPPQAAAKLNVHGVDASCGGLLPTGNAAILSAAPPTLGFPTINPDSTINTTGTFGQLNTSGGIKLTKCENVGGGGAGPCEAAGHPIGVFISIDNVRIDLESKTASGEVTTPIGAIGRLNVSDLSAGTFSTDSNARTVSFTSIQSNLTSTSPTLLNSVFGTSGEGCGPAATDFVGGESLGTISGNVQTQ